MKVSLHKTIDGRSMLRFERHFRHPQERVWRAITDPEQITHWFPSSMEMKLEPGAKIRFTMPDAPEQYAYQDGEVLEFDPPRLFAYSWHDSTLRWELRPDGDGCLLVFTQTFDDRPYAASYATGWESCIDALASLLDGKPTSNQPEDYPRRHEAYAEYFGLTEGSAKEEDGGWTARLERMLPWPVEVVQAEADETWEVTSAGPGGTRVAMAETGLKDEAEARRLLTGWQQQLAEISERLLNRAAE